MRLLGSSAVALALVAAGCSNNETSSEEPRSAGPRIADPHRTHPPGARAAAPCPLPGRARQLRDRERQDHLRRASRPRRRRRCALRPGLPRGDHRPRPLGDRREAIAAPLPPPRPRRPPERGRAGVSRLVRPKADRGDRVACGLRCRAWASRRKGCCGVSSTATTIPTSRRITCEPSSCSSASTRRAWSTPSERRAILEELLGEIGPDVEIKPRFLCDYGYQTTVGEGTFINYGAIFLDCAPITVGRHCQIATNVQLAHRHPPAGTRGHGARAGSRLIRS